LGIHQINAIKGSTGEDKKPMDMYMEFSFTDIENDLYKECKIKRLNTKSTSAATPVKSCSTTRPKENKMAL